MSKNVQLKDICSKAGSNIAQKDIANANGVYPIYGASGFIKNVDFYQQEKEYVAIVKDGAGVGRTMLLPSKSSVIGTIQYILPKENIMPRYLYYILTSLDLVKYATGATIPHIYFKDYSKEKVFLPTIAKQQQIAATLDKASELIALHKKQLEELDVLAESVFYDMFGDPVKNEKGWEIKTISALVKKESNSLKRGPFGGALKKEIFVNEGCLVYEQYHALNNDYSFARYFIDENKFDELKSFEVAPDDIIISCSGVNLGRLSIIPQNAKKGIINQALLKLSLNQYKMLNAVFVRIFENDGFKNKYFGNQRGCAIPNFPPMLAILEATPDVYYYTSNVKAISNNLLKKTNLPVVKLKETLLRNIASDAFGKESFSLNVLENTRIEIRELIRLLDKEKRKIVYSNFTDEITSSVVSDAMFTYVISENYKQRVERYVRKNENHQIIQKLRKNIPITHAELNELEKLLFDGKGRGTKDDFVQSYGEQPLGQFIRSIVGLDVNAAKEAFSEFLNAGNLSADQIRFVDMIIDYLSTNGIIDVDMLFEEPFTTFHTEGIAGLFDERGITKLLSILHRIDANAAA